MIRKLTFTWILKASIKLESKLLVLIICNACIIPILQGGISPTLKNKFYSVKVAIKICGKPILHITFNAIKIPDKSGDFLWRRSWIVHNKRFYKIKNALIFTKINIHQQKFARNCILMLSKHLKWILRSFWKIFRFFPISLFLKKSDTMSTFLTGIPNCEIALDGENYLLWKAQLLFWY